MTLTTPVSQAMLRYEEICDAHHTMFVFCLLYEVELSSSSRSSTAGYSSVNTKSLSIPPTTTPWPPCMCDMSDCMCSTWVCFLRTAPLLPVIVGVVPTGVIIITVVVVTVCLLIVAKHKHKKNSLGKDSLGVLLLLLFVHWCCFPQLPLTTFIGHHLP